MSSSALAARDERKARVQTVETPREDLEVTELMERFKHVGRDLSPRKCSGCSPPGAENESKDSCLAQHAG